VPISMRGRRKGRSGWPRVGKGVGAARSWEGGEEEGGAGARLDVGRADG
jgi:hypothetical protein